MFACPATDDFFRARGRRAVLAGNDSSASLARIKPPSEWMAGIGLGGVKPLGTWLARAEMNKSATTTYMADSWRRPGTPIRRAAARQFLFDASLRIAGPLPMAQS